MNSRPTSKIKFVYYVVEQLLQHVFWIILMILFTTISIIHIALRVDSRFHINTSNLAEYIRQAVAGVLKGNSYIILDSTVKINVTKSYMAIYLIKRIQLFPWY